MSIVHDAEQRWMEGNMSKSNIEKLFYILQQGPAFRFLLSNHDMLSVARHLDANGVIAHESGQWLKTFRYMRKNIDTGNIEPVYSYDCPICEYHTGNQGRKFNFCPNCGAKMDGKEQQ